jgi:hypothetical protein
LTPISFAFDSSIDFLSLPNIAAFAAPVMFANMIKYISRGVISKARQDRAWFLFFQGHRKIQYAPFSVRNEPGISPFLF